jgi:hypothetical protein
MVDKRLQGDVDLPVHEGVFNLVQRLHLGVCMPGIFIASNGPDDWRGLLADPEKHWRTGYSAKALAYCWEEDDGFPTQVALLFSDSGIPTFQSIELLLAIPEHQVPLPGGGRPSQNDLFALASCRDGLISIMVEGKVSEPFGPTVEEWLIKASPGKYERLEYLRNQIGLDKEFSPHIRYQLIHRTASAVIEARRFCAKTAVMIVHSFSQEDLWFED